ncbi:hypothetical protein [Frankia sp. CiP3]|uniref:hypothetical protein n=1 Tax=Frankia sp. CiP3 TaxID=2880971 RepID=UPI001EF726A8|nr:hypothetical protein [Frankia sp. CiP3]
MKRVGASADPAILAAFEEAGIALFGEQGDLAPGDSLFLGADLATDDMIRRMGRLDLPGVPLVLVTTRRCEGTDGLDLRRRARALGGCGVWVLPGCLPYLRRFVAVLDNRRGHRPSGPAPTGGGRTDGVRRGRRARCSRRRHVHPTRPDPRRPALPDGVYDRRLEQPGHPRSRFPVDRPARTGPARYGL